MIGASAAFTSGIRSKGMFGISKPCRMVMWSVPSPNRSAICAMVFMSSASRCPPGTRTRIAVAPRTFVMRKAFFVTFFLLRSRVISRHLSVDEPGGSGEAEYRPVQADVGGVYLAVPALSKAA